MQVVILAGGRGTRLAEETATRPKPMVEIGGKPMLWHLMHVYARSGFKDFLVACGYRGEVIKEYFHDVYLHTSDYFIDLATGKVDTVTPSDRVGGAIDWRVGVIDTGIETMTGGRLLRLRRYLESGTFMATYGDGLANVDIERLVEFHRAHGKVATVTAVRPPARFGALALAGDRVTMFAEKPQAEEGWINGGFFVFEPELFDYISGDESILEREPLERLAAEGQLMAYRHAGFWQAMDTVRDRRILEGLWASGEAPWMRR